MLEPNLKIAVLFVTLISLLSVAAFWSTRFLIPMIIRRAFRWGLLDLPDGRKAHKHPTPRLGGISIAPGLWLGCASALLLASKLNVGGFPQMYSQAVTGLFLGCSGMFLLGLFDDLKHLNAQQKLVVQALIAFVAVNFLPTPESIFGLASPLGLSNFFIVAWLIVVPNSVNLLDGVDGLTATLTALFLGVVSLMACISGQFAWLLVTGPSLAAILSFLKFNWSPAKIFLGDSGSLSIGFMVAYMSLYFSFAPAESGPLSWNPLIASLLTLPWLADTAFAIGRRYFKNAPPLSIFARRSKAKYFAFHGAALGKIWRPDRGHIHHQLQRLGLSSSKVVGIIAFFSFFSMLAAALLISVATSNPRLPQGLILIIATVFTGLTALFFATCFRAIFHTEMPPSKSDQEIAA